MTLVKPSCRIVIFAITLTSVLAAAVLMPRAAHAADALIAAISVNGEPKGDYHVLRGADGGFLVKADDLSSLGFKAAAVPVVEIRGERYVSLLSLSGVVFSFDDKVLSLSIIAPPALLEKTVIDLTPGKRAAVLIPKETSAFFNYNVTYSHADPLGFQSLSAGSKAGVRSGDGLFLTDALYTKTPDSDHMVRLSSAFTYERRGELQLFTAGDMFASSGDLGSTINIGGFGVSKIYRMDPYFVRQPTFSLTGAAAFPSQAEIYLDGALVGRERVAPGEFELKNFYYYGGAHTVEVVMKDPFGNERRLVFPLYFTDTLLKRGLHEYSYNIGFLREQYGVQSNEYGRPAFSAFHRYGATDALSIGARAEGTDGMYNTGAQASFAIARGGIVTASLARSSGGGRSGSAAAFQHVYQKGRFSTNLFLREYSEGYVTLAQPALEPTRFEGGAGAGYATMTRGAFSIDYAALRKYTGQDRDVVSASYSRNLSKDTALTVTLRTTRETNTEYEFLVSFNYYPGKDTLASARYQRTADGNIETVQYQKNAPTGEGAGYRASLERTDTGAASATALAPFLQYNARYGVYTADLRLQQADGKTTESSVVSASGAIVYAGGVFGLTRPVSDSFGIVQVDGLRDVAVKVNNEEVGRTDASGRMIIPGLKSYFDNQVSLDPRNISMEYNLLEVKQDVSPALWSGSCIVFHASRMQAVTGRIFALTPAGRQPIEFAEIMLEARNGTLAVPVGKGGEFYFENTGQRAGGAGLPVAQGCRALAEKQRSDGAVVLPGRYPASVDYLGKTCSFAIVIPESDDVIIDIGGLECVPR